jgi:hypothetical protein
MHCYIFKLYTPFIHLTYTTHYKITHFTLKTSLASGGIARAQPNSREKGANYAAVFGENVKLRGRLKRPIPR